MSVTQYDPELCKSYILAGFRNLENQNPTGLNAAQLDALMEVADSAMLEAFKHATGVDTHVEHVENREPAYRIVAELGVKNARHTTGFDNDIFTQKAEELFNTHAFEEYDQLKELGLDADAIKRFSAAFRGAMASSSETAMRMATVGSPHK